jgi:pilus assembly protein Flp/PilA
MQSKIVQFIFDTSGATAIEYALVASGIAIAIVVAIGNLGGNLGNQFNNIANAVP